MPKSIKIKGGKFKLPWKGPYKVGKTFNNNIVKLTTHGNDEVERVNNNKLKEYHSKNVVADVMVANVHVKRYPNRYRRGRTSTIVPKILSRLVPKPRKLPRTGSIPKIVDDEYFWIKEERLRSSERKARSSGYKVIFKKRKSLYPSNYALREKGHKEGYLQPPNLDPTRKNKEVITRILKNPLNELWPIWPLDTLLNLEELVELKKIKQRYYMWKKCYGKDNEHVTKWNTQTRKIVEQQNQRKIERSIEPHKVWFKPNTRKFSGKVVFEEQKRTRFASSFVEPNCWKVFCEQ
jgi:hypothetical protein